MRRKVREEKRREMEGDLLVRGRDIQSDESRSSSSGSDDLLGKGVVGKCGRVVRKGTKKLKGLVGAEKEKKKKGWRDFKRIKGMRTIE